MLKKLTLKNLSFQSKVQKPQNQLLEVDPRGERTLGVLTKMASWQQVLMGNV